MKKKLFNKKEPIDKNLVGVMEERDPEPVELITPFIVSDKTFQYPMTKDNIEQEVLTRRFCLTDVFANEVRVLINNVVDIFMLELKEYLDTKKLSNKYEWLSINYFSIRRAINVSLEENYGFIYHLFSYSPQTSNSILINDFTSVELGLSLAIDAYRIACESISDTLMGSIFRRDDEGLNFDDPKMVITQMYPFAHYNLNLTDTFKTLYLKAQKLYFPSGVVQDIDLTSI